MDDFEDLECNLRKLTPRSASADLKARIAQRLNGKSCMRSGDRESRRRNILLAWPWTSVAAAIVLSAGVIFYQGFFTGETEVPAVAEPKNPPAEKTRETAVGYVPVLAGRTLVSAKDDGVIDINGHGPMRRIRYQTVEHMEWESTQNGKKLMIDYPVNNVVYVRLATY